MAKTKQTSTPARAGLHLHDITIERQPTATERAEFDAKVLELAVLNDSGF